LKALVLQAQNELHMADVPKPVPGPEEMLIRTRAATICTSDLYDIKYNPFHISLPVTIGHEGAGVVEAIGCKVTDFAVGDEVAAHPVIPCGQCSACRDELGHLCENMGHLGIDRGGVFAEFFAIRQDRARKKPPELSFSQSTLMEPVSVCLESIERAAVRAGGAVLILGDGPFGIMTALLCQSYKPSRVILTGRHPHRMSFARNCTTVNEKQTENITEDILALTDGRGVDSAILCVGSNLAVDTALAVLRPRGTLSVFSAIDGKASVDLFRVHVKELNICGSCNDMNYLDKALELLCDKNLNLQSMITHELEFEDWEKAFALASNGKDTALKVSLLFD